MNLTLVYICLYILKFLERYIPFHFKAVLFCALIMIFEQDDVYVITQRTNTPDE